MNYVPIRLSTIKPSTPITFNVYIQLKVSQKYLLYVQDGDDINKERLANLKTKKVRQLFIEDTDEGKYQQFIDDTILKAAMDENMSGAERAVVAQGVAEGAVEDMFEKPEDKQAFELTEKAAESLVKIIPKNKDVLKSVFERTLTSDADAHFKHAVNVSSMACCLGSALEYSDEDLSTIAAAALLADIGKTKMNDHGQSLFYKKLDEFTEDDWKEYKKHPKIGAELLEEKPYVNAQILDIILNHEERRSGEGFPEGKTKLDPKVEIVGICCCYDRKVTILGMTHEDAIKDMVLSEVGNFELSLINTLKEVLKKEGI